MNKAAGAFIETIKIMGDKPLKLSTVVTMASLGTFFGIIKGDLL